MLCLESYKKLTYKSYLSQLVASSQRVFLYCLFCWGRHRPLTWLNLYCMRVTVFVFINSVQVVIQNNKVYNFWTIRMSFLGLIDEIEKNSLIFLNSNNCDLMFSDFGTWIYGENVSSCTTNTWDIFDHRSLLQNIFLISAKLNFLGPLVCSTICSV